MKDYKTLEELNDLIEKELKTMVQKGSLTPNELESAEKAVCLMEKIIRLKEGFYDDGYSSRYSMPRMGYDMQYGDGSYARGRSSVTGRYVSRDGGYYDGYSQGYSGHSIEDRAVDSLERIMDSAESQYERDQLRKFIRQIRADEMK